MGSRMTLNSMEENEVRSVQRKERNGDAGPQSTDPGIHASAYRLLPSSEKPLIGSVPPPPQLSKCHLTSSEAVSLREIL